MTAVETPIPVEQMPAGHELDLLVATLVLGLPVIDDGPDARDVRYVHAEDGTLPHHWIRIERYSTEIKAAWTVVEHLTDVDGPCGDQKWSFGLEFSSVIGWVCDFTPRGVHPQSRDYQAFRVEGFPAPLAICRAALLAVGR